MERQSTISFSSDPANGALNRSANGSTFTAQLDNAQLIPENAVYATGEIVQARIWNTTPNISALGNNNKFRILTALGGGDFTMTIPNGLYSLSELNTFISRECVNLGYPLDLVLLGSDASTNKVVITYPYINTQVDFAIADSCRNVLGFSSRRSPWLAPSTAGQSDSGDTQAGFNQINAYGIRGNLVGYGIPTNNLNNGIMAQIPINAKPGSQILYSPYNPQRFDCTELIGKTRNTVSFELIDDKGRSADTNGEYYQFELVFRYFI